MLIFNCRITDNSLGKTNKNGGVNNGKGKKENIVMIVLIVVMLLAIIGVSYAAFNYSKTGTKLNSITTGSITMSYTESDSIISIDKALPTHDETGKVRLKEGEYFDFTVSSEIVGDININYEISVKDVTTSNRKIDGSNIKLYLTRLTDNGEEELMSPETYNEEINANSYTGRPTGEMSLYQGSMGSSESNRYRLRMWVDEKYNPQDDGGNLQFSVKINVYGKDGNKEDLYKTVAETLLTSNLGNGDIYDDGEDTFITGEEPNNYIWYSGKLWRAVAVNNEAKTTKLVTQWNISTVSYNASDSTAFAGSYMEDWLNDTTVDGFLGNLRDPDKFIVTDSVWDATIASTALGSITRPNKITTVTDAVGLLNMYEYQTSYTGTTYENGYLNNRLQWWTLTPYGISNVLSLDNFGDMYYNAPDYDVGIRPSINLKSSIKVVDGDGTIDNPYRLEGDNDTNLSGTLLNKRYSGEYIRFGNDENNLYRIVSHENGAGTRIVSEKPLKSSGTFIRSSFGSNVTFSSRNTIGSFLNGDYLTNYVDSKYINMIEDNTTWYLGTVGYGTSYKLAKYTDTTGTTLTSSTANAKVGLLRYGELMTGHFDRLENITDYWLLTPRSTSDVWYLDRLGEGSWDTTNSDYTHGVRPSMNLKSNVQIVNGDGTKNNPFIVYLAS